jgi:dsDNA-specific endonuclease/ATPase MutS2
VIFDFVSKRIRRERLAEKPKPAATAIDENESESFDPDNPFPEIVAIEFQDVIDLHSIPPKQTRAVVEDYIEEARRRGVRFVRIIHGKGVGVQREIVRSILGRTSCVVDFHDAPAEAGGWGATLVTLSTDEKSFD